MKVGDSSGAVCDGGSEVAGCGVAGICECHAGPQRHHPHPPHIQ